MVVYEKMIIRAYFMEVSDEGVVFAGRVGFVENTLEQIERYMGLPIEVTYLTQELVLIKSQEMEKKLPVNRALVRDGEAGEILRGNLICVRQGKDGFASIEDKDIREIRKHLTPVFELDGQMFMPKEL